MAKYGSRAFVHNVSGKPDLRDGERQQRPPGEARRAAASLLALLCLVVFLPVAHAARFTDPFLTSPAEPGREPFAWDHFRGYTAPGSVWTAEEGAITYRTENQTGAYSGLAFSSAGIDITDESRWALEVGFRHISGIAPPAYLFVCYTRWSAADPGQMRILGLAYDAENHELLLYNATGNEAPIAVDLSGDFHPVRLAVGDGQVSVFVDGRLAGGPYALKSRAYGAAKEFLIGPLTNTEEHSLHAQWSYLAFTDEGAFAPGEGEWEPAADTEPVAKGLSLVKVPDVFDSPPYPGVQIVSKEKGNARWEQAVPETMRRYRQTMRDTPNPIEVLFYSYPDDPGPSKQNVYQNAYVLQYDATRLVGNAMLTRGVGDTATGFVDYKMWYRVSTDGGETFTDLRPIVQQGEGHSPMHPIEYVWVGKNSFCYATIPGIMLRLSNGQIFFPCYYAPLDEAGNYYNPLNAYTFSRVCGIIGTWNEAGDDLLWDVSDPVILTPEQASRGAGECAVIELAEKPGHLAMVIRGSNAPNPTGKIPAYKWKTLSTDYGKTWSPCEPFSYDDGEPIISPAACSSFIRSSRTGKCYWIGNISRTLPQGNSPRYPLVIGEVDEDGVSLRRHTLTIVDDRQPDDPPDLQLSNYNLVEDEKTGEFVLQLNRYMSAKEAPGAGPHTYVIRVR